MERTIGIEPT